VRILIVDDYEPWRRYVRSVLAADPDLEILGESADGLDAIKQSEELQPGLVLLDIQLPSINGLEVARQIGVVSQLYAECRGDAGGPEVRGWICYEGRC
jgi:DNA-binding NarL/FixJ family response regulator